MGRDRRVDGAQQGLVVRIPLGPEGCGYGRCLRADVMEFYFLLGDGTETDLAGIASSPVAFRAMVDDEALLDGTWPKLGTVPLTDEERERPYLWRNDEFEVWWSKPDKDAELEPVPRMDRHGVLRPSRHLQWPTSESGTLQVDDDKVMDYDPDQYQWPGSVVDRLRLRFGLSTDTPWYALEAARRPLDDTTPPRRGRQWTWLPEDAEQPPPSAPPTRPFDNPEAQELIGHLGELPAVEAVRTELLAVFTATRTPVSLADARRAIAGAALVGLASGVWTSGLRDEPDPVASLVKHHRIPIDAVTRKEARLALSRSTADGGVWAGQWAPDDLDGQRSMLSVTRDYLIGEPVPYEDITPISDSPYAMLVVDNEPTAQRLARQAAGFVGGLVEAVTRRSTEPLEDAEQWHPHVDPDDLHLYTGPFSSDRALDLLYDLEGAMDAEEVRELVNEALRLRVIGHQYLDRDEGETAYAAASLVAVAAGMPADEHITCLVADLPIPRDPAIRSRAATAIRRATGADSEMADLWEHSGVLAEGRDQANLALSYLTRA